MFMCRYIRLSSQIIMAFDGYHQAKLARYVHTSIIEAYNVEKYILAALVILNYRALSACTTIHLLPEQEKTQVSVGPYRYGDFV